MVQRKTLLPLSLLVALVACSGPENEPAPESQPGTGTSPTVTSAQDTAAEQTTAAEDQAATEHFLPPGVTLSAAAEQRSMHGYTTKAGAERRVVIFELRNGDIESTADSLKSDMERAGFSARDEADRGDGKTRITFIKPGYGRVNASLTTDVGDKPLDPNAPGVFSLDIPLEPEPASGT